MMRLAKNSLDVGLVTTRPEESLTFYRDVLGLPHEGEFPMPGGSMHRLTVGTSVLKIVSLRRVPRGRAHPGGLAGATGYRYLTLTVVDLDDALAICVEAGATIALAATVLPTGGRIAMVADPDGNWVELVQQA